MLENNNLVPLLTFLLLVTRLQFLQKGENLAIPEYLVRMPTALYMGFYITPKFPVVIHITNREIESWNLSNLAKVMRLIKQQS